ncbi:MAG: polyphosphate kinase 2 family protein [Oligoflexia bacterium]|nr:polyphosphate kinase 2 family protein [Oligoflexia bacterium]
MPENIAQSLRIHREDRDNFNLAKFPTSCLSGYSDHADYLEKLGALRQILAERQERLYASQERALLVVLQAMDTAGKDGVIEHVLSGMNPQGVEVTCFKRPSETELGHSYLWRHDGALPARGKIGVWNRSHYEEVGVVRVHPEYLAARGIDPEDATKRFWNQRLDEIKHWERTQASNGIEIVKIFLHISKAEQAQRLLDRIEDPKKHWKFRVADLAERERWKEYMHAYGAAIAATSTKFAPWYVVPADDKSNARLAVAQILEHHLSDDALDLPKMSAEDLRKLPGIRRELMRELQAHR